MSRVERMKAIQFSAGIFMAPRASMVLPVRTPRNTTYPRALRLTRRVFSRIKRVVLAVRGSSGQLFTSFFSPRVLQVPEEELEDDAREIFESEKFPWDSTVPLNERRK